MSNPVELKYTKDHEWIKVEGDIAHVGITDHAQEALGDIVYVELPEVGDEVSKGDEATSVESVKAAAAIYAPLSGEIVGVNESLEDEPENLNSAPYENPIFSLKMSDQSELDDAMTAAEYEEFLQNAE